MITKRTSDKTVIASIYDTALLELKEYGKVRKYMVTRNAKDIGMDADGKIASSGKYATLFDIRPLPQKMIEAIRGANDSPVTQIMIFRECVRDIRNAGDIRITKDSEGNLSEETIESMGMDIIKDVALYCVEQVEGKNGSTIPFSSRDGWQTHASRQAAFDATFATTATENVNGASSDSK